jgi:hypothetical protein
VSLNKCTDDYHNCFYEIEKINNLVFHSSTVNEELCLKIKGLKTGYYQIIANTIAVSGSGKLEKEETVYNFEITDNQ